ncbi:MAG: non-hydrolyzing UDP-N-acetylglucosamine 2-epimerase [Smithellaceae bacterium]
MKVVTIIGARPQFIKAAPMSQKLRDMAKEVLVHTGQHYDNAMSDIFFRELGIPDPDYNLNVGSGTHGMQTSQMLLGIEKVLIAENPDWVLIYGDTNSTLAGALAASKLHIPVAHIEAGLRSYNRLMPEEINRVLADHLSTVLFCPSKTAVDNLRMEGITQGVHIVGDVMADSVMLAGKMAGDHAQILSRLGLVEKEYLLATVHRAENTDSPNFLSEILNSFNEIEMNIIFPVHPRTQKVMQNLGWSPASHVILIDPVGYLDMITLEKSARMILTDSGGIQKEAYWLSVPCITMREESEWVETIEAGWNILTGADKNKIIDAVRSYCPPEAHPQLYGDGQTADQIIKILLN